MLTGRRAFEGASAPAVMAAILRDDPPSLGSVQPPIPAALQRLVLACLARNPDDRVSTMHDVLWQLRGIAEEAGAGVRSAPIGAVERGGRRRWMVAAAALAIVLAGAAVAWRLRPDAPVLTNRDTVVLADFDNTTNDSVFDGALKQALAFSLEQSPYLNIMAQARIDETLKLMTRPAGDRITRAIAQEICQRQNLKAFVAGAISPVGSQYAISLEAVNGLTGEVLARELEQVESKERVLAAVGNAASRMRAQLGEPLTSIKTYDTPLQLATTSSLEALRNYSIGVDHFRRGDYENAILAYVRATELDPDFAKAWDSLVPAYGNTSRAALARNAVERAFALRKRASERERMLIEARYQFTAEQNLRAALGHYKRFLAIYPDSDAWWASIAQIHRQLGEPENAIEPAREALRRDDTNSIAAVHLAVALMAVGSEGEAKRVIDTRRLEDVLARRARFEIAFMEQDPAGMKQAIDAAAALQLRGLVLGLQSEAAGFEGRVRQAQALSRQSGEAVGGVGPAARDAVRYAAFDACAPALTEARRALARSPTSGEAALALSWCGDTAGAEIVARDQAKRFPNGTLVHGLWIPLIRAAGALRRDPGQALLLLQKAEPLQKSNFAVFRPQYLRGLAYLNLNRHAEATVEFQRILDNRGLAPLSPLFPLAYVGLARAATIAGDVPKARRAFEDFFALWHSADADVPILVRARKEYAALRERAAAESTRAGR